MRKIFLSLVLVAMFLTGCSVDKRPNDIDYQIALVRTTEKTERSTILFYDQNLECLGEMEIPYGGLGHEARGRRLWQVGNLVTLVPHGLMGDYDTRKVIEFNSETLDYKVLSIDRSNIGYAAQSDNYIYTTSNSNGTSYLSQYSLLDGTLKEISYNPFSEVAWVVNATSKYVFVSTEVQGEYDELGGQDEFFSRLRIYNENLDLLKTIDLLEEEYGTYINHGIEYDNSYYFPSNYIDNVDGTEIKQGRLLKLDLDTLEIEVINLTRRGPNQVEVYGSKLAVLHFKYGPSDPASLTIYNPQSETVEKSLEFEEDIIRFVVKDDLLFGLVYDQKDYTYSLVIYDLLTFQKKDEIKLEVEDTNANQYFTGLFVKNKE